MRLVAGALALTLFASFAGADDPGSQGDPVRVRPAPGATQKVPLRVVRVMPESRQALLYDRSRSTHVLAEVGGQIGGYTVEDIDGDEVTLRFQDKQIVLAAPARASERRVAGRPARSGSGSSARPGDAAPSGAGPSDAAPSEAEPSDATPSDATPSDAGASNASNSGPNTAGSSAGEPTPVDPYGEPPIRVVRAPDAPAGPGPAAPASELRAGEGGVRVVRAPAAPGEPSAAAPVASPSIGPAAPNGSDAEAPPAASPAASPQASDGAAPAIRVAQAPAPRSAPAKTPYQADKQAIDARAMADVLTGSARDGAKPRTLSLGSPPQASEPARPSAPASSPSASNPSASNPSASNPSASNPSASNPSASNSSASSQSASNPSSNPSASNPAASSASNPSASAPATSANAVVISRGEVQAALADFGRLTAAIHGSFSASGVVVNAIGDGTLFQRAGLRAGDVIASVDGVRLRSLDDAANVYARASTAAAMTAQIVRSGKPMTLHVAIR